MLPAHAFASIPSGGTFAAYQARNQTPSQQGVETLAGLFGGYLGGRLPDLIDPPDCPNHRGIGHSVFAITIAGTVIYKNLSDWQGWFRDLADRARARADSATDELSRAFFVIAEFLFRAAAGLIAGVIGGYPPISQAGCATIR